MSLTREHRALLEGRGIHPGRAEAAGVRSVAIPEELPVQCPGHWTVANGYLPGLLFAWVAIDGRVEYQIRPDEHHRPVDGHGRPIKYATRSRVDGYQPVLWVAQRGDPDGVRLITEGTCQTLAASCYAPPGAWVLGMIGCRGWMSQGTPTVDLSLVEGAEAVVALDADLWHKRGVWDSAEVLQRALRAEGAVLTRFLRLPAGADAGLDDLLGNLAPERRERYLGHLMDEASTEKFPASRRPGLRPEERHEPFFSENGLQVRELAQAVYRQNPLLLTRDRRVAVYRDGVFQTESTALMACLTDMLGDNYRPTHRVAVEEFLVGSLDHAGHYLPAHQSEPLINVRNGMVDPSTGTLKPHDPAYRSSVQLPVKWDPEATCPHYEEWITQQAGSQVDDLEECLSVMLDPTMTPSKGVLLYGPERTGKGTLLRLMQQMAGDTNRSAVTLHQLSDDRFAAAHLYGSILNTSGDLSAAHIEDVSLFKMLTGGDTILANRKYGAQFSFTNQALLAFATNEPPTVGESSRAYFERVKPFEFACSFAGHESQETEDAMVSELPGILVRWVRAYRRFVDRGGYQPTDPGVRGAFETSSDRVRQWVAEEMTVVMSDSKGGVVSPGAEVPPGYATPPRALARAFNQWADGNGGSRIGERKVIKRLTSMDGVHEVRIAPSGQRGLNIVKREGGGEASGTPGTSGPNDLSGKMKSNTGGEDFLFFPNGSVRATSARSATAAGVRSLSLDIETASADQLWSCDQGFIRLCGYQNGTGDIHLTPRAETAAGQIERAGTVIGHNLLGFDLLALAHHHGLDLASLVTQDRVLDTKLVAFLADPPPARMKAGQIEKRYSLDEVSQRYGLGGKRGDLTALKKEFGGYDRIPVDDERYRAYLRGDVELTGQLAGVLPVTEYTRREHRIAGIAAQISLNGFRVDTDLLASRLQQGRSRRAELLDRLVTDHGLPTTRKDGSPSLSPHNTQRGREAIARAFQQAGADRMPRTDTGAYATGHDAMMRMKTTFSHVPAVIELAELVQALNGIRTIYETIDEHRVDDRVHPMIEMRQASGRWSTTQPGLTVLGKRGGRYVEREVFLPEPGHVLLAADLAQVDARAVAALSGDTAYQQLFAPGRDVHSEIAQQIWGDPARREDAKAIGHGWNYGMSIAGLAKTASVSDDVAAEFDRGMREQFPRLIEWREDIYQQARAEELLDNGFGRMMRPDPGRSYTQGVALMGQGCARDLFMEGLLRLPRELYPYLRAVVHDELVLSVPAEGAHDIARTVVEAMSFEWCGVPIVAEASETGSNWGALYAK